MDHLKRLSLSALSVWVLTACSGTENEPNIGAAMSAVGGPIPTTVSVDSPPPPVDTVEPIEVVDTKSLIVADDFAFETAQHINVDFDLEDARGTTASVSICTGYSRILTNEYDINYDSCTVRGTMSDGVFQHQMDVTNEYSEVVAVVWFDDQSITPVYREFSIRDETSQRTPRSVMGEKVIVWR